METTEEKAKKLIEEIASQWESTPDAFFSREDGAIHFTVVAHGKHGSSTIHLNPQAIVVEFIEEYARRALSWQVDEVMRQQAAQIHVEMSFICVLLTAQQHFTDSLWELRVKSTDGRAIQNNLQFGDVDEAERRYQIIQEAFNQKLRQRFGVQQPTPGKRPKRGRLLNKVEVYTVVLGPINNGGECPSEAQAAKSLGIARTTLRKWYADQGFDSWAEFCVFISREAVLYSENIKHVDEQN